MGLAAVTAFAGALLLLLQSSLRVARDEPRYFAPTCLAAALSRCSGASELVRYPASSCSSAKCFCSLFPWAQLRNSCALIETRKLDVRHICGLVLMQRIIIGWPESQRLMLDDTRYRLRLIQLRILSRLHRRLLTPELGHPLAVLRIYLTIFLLALGMRSKTNHLLAQHLHAISPICLLIGRTSIGLEDLHLVLAQKLDLLLMLLVLGVCLVYGQYLLLLGLGQGHQPTSILIVLREKLRLLL